jgi:GNAT superfamily N-acetyltransferase
VRKIEQLDSTHDRKNFDCGVEPLNRYLQQIAHQHLTKSIATTYVLVEDDAAIPKPILGFFTLTVCELHGEQVPLKWAKRLPEKIPAFRLGRLAVASDQQGAGLGKMLVFEAVRRVATVAAVASGIGLVVDAKDEAAGAFYTELGFEPAQLSPLTFFMPIATIRQIAG